MSGERDNSSSEARWQRLNAFVDGELAPREAARVAREIADDPTAAADAAALGEMKAALGGAIPPREIPVPGGTGPARSGRRRAVGAVGAALALLLVVAVGWRLLPGTGATGQPAPPWLAAALGQHETLSDMTDQPTTLRQAAMPGPDRAFAPYVPDLTAGKLRIGRVLGFTGPDGAEAFAANYRGNRGCRLTLVAFADGAEGLAESLQPLGRFGDVAASGYVWRVGGVRYLLVADGMDGNRLATIARTVHRGSHLHRPIDPDGRTRMAEARAKSVPCPV